ncbi:MAG TPA: methyltransferase domain-containing protein [Hyphomicrobiaceae bacterium]|nr:methyltransferase domain-containing protein [Hyphomicrobiaceae bacterium]
MSDAAAPAIFDRRLLTRRRGRAAARGSGPDFLLDRVAEDLLERLSLINRRFCIAVDLGAHHGLLGRRLRRLDGIGMVVETDLSPPMLALCQGPRVLADEELLPFRSGSLDLVVSALTLQLVNDLPGTLIQIRRALKPDGLLLAAMLGGDTLTELRQSFLAAEVEIEGGASPRVAPFADVRDLGSLLQRAGFALPVADSEIVRVGYASPLEVMREIKAMGASNMLISRRRTPMRRATLARACEIYAERFGRADGRVTATFEILTMTGWVPHESQQQPLRPGSAKARLADALGVEEHSAGEKAAE